jgi:hypothetical protein
MMQPFGTHIDPASLRIDPPRSSASETSSTRTSAGLRGLVGRDLDLWGRT